MTPLLAVSTFSIGAADVNALQTAIRARQKVMVDIAAVSEDGHALEPPPGTHIGGQNALDIAVEKFSVIARTSPGEVALCVVRVSPVSGPFSLSGWLDPTLSLD